MWRLDPSLAILGLALLLPATWGFGYPVLGIETVLAIVSALVLAASITVLTAKYQASRMAAMGFLFFSLVAPALIPSHVLAWVTVSIGAVALSLLRQRIQPQFFVAFALVFAPLKYLHDTRDLDTRVIARAPASAASDQILVHWIMDEMGSFDSIPPELRNEAEIDEIRAAYEARGFRIRSDSPSVSADTLESLGTLFDIDTAARGVPNMRQVEGRNAYKIQRNSLHRLLAGKRWEVSISQSSYVDFCLDAAWDCRTYAMGKNAHLFAEAGIPLAQRTEIVGRLLFATLSGQAHEAWRRTPDLSLAALDAMEALTTRAKAAHGKHYFFGHFLLPHFPWTLGKDCRVKPLGDWQVPDTTGASESAEYHAAMTRGYWQQAYCTHKRVLAAVDALDAAHPGRVRFLIHGDHGPRIVRRVLPGTGGYQAYEHRRLSMVEPFIASRLESDAGSEAAVPETMQALLQRLLALEAALPTYGPLPDVRP